MAYLSNIAIVGATGTVGKFILSELLATGKHKVTAITRKDSQAVLPNGVKTAEVNYDDQSTLVAALRGQQALIITLSVSAPKGTELKLVEAAAKADVPYVIPNGWGLDPFNPSSSEAFLGRDLREIQKHIEKLGKSSWIEFVSGGWYEFSLGGTTDRYGFDIQNRSVIFYDDGMARINTSTWDQTGRAVSKVLSLKENPEDKDADSLTLSSFKNKCVYFSSFYVSQKDMFESVLRVTGTKQEDWKISYENSAERYQSGLDLMKQGDRRGFSRAMYVRMFYPEGSSNGAGAYEPVRGLHNDVLGLPKEDLDERTKIAINRSEEFIRLYS